ncbi:hypothetical protein BDK51DRAFT_33258 [Blyttiomyces helicus]|uniref:P-type domain-containing protein n=1 Tax=Blyttiomyces helicus TaxID=388810 RepID=A0A4P9WE00_9FUNG|nr:hypothetical protein BDK51DRAFT_33258 [Blyttiomyces helicus]|eukprot:RKO89468.1 hypothetical protein BDK51DRAFT_33258 [Blyttiomyces helicus]
MRADPRGGGRGGRLRQAQETFGEIADCEDKEGWGSRVGRSISTVGVPCPVTVYQFESCTAFQIWGLAASPLAPSYLPGLLSCPVPPALARSSFWGSVSRTGALWVGVWRHWFGLGWRVKARRDRQRWAVWQGSFFPEKGAMTPNHPGCGIVNRSQLLLKSQKEKFESPPSSLSHKDLLGQLSTVLPSISPLSRSATSVFDMIFGYPDYLRFSRRCSSPPTPETPDARSSLLPISLLPHRGGQWGESECLCSKGGDGGGESDRGNWKIPFDCFLANNKPYRSIIKSFAANRTAFFEAYTDTWSFMNTFNPAGINISHELDVTAPTTICPTSLSARKDCGFFGIKESECAARECCWSPVTLPPLDQLSEHGNAWQTEASKIEGRGRGQKIE